MRVAEEEIPGQEGLPPVTQVGMVSLALILAGGIYLAAHLPQHVPLAPAAILLGLSAALLAGNVLALSRVKGFAWERFFAVGRWALLAYAIMAGLIAYALVRDHVPTNTLVILCLSLVVYAVHVPLLTAFTVARYETAAQPAPPEGQPGAAAPASSPPAL